MNAKRLFTAVLLVLVLAAAGKAWSFVLENEEALNRVSQLVNLKGMSTTGELTSISRILPNGTEAPFAFPPGRVLLITRFYFDFAPTSPVDSINVRFEPFLYPAANGAKSAAGNFSGSQGFASGCPVGLPSAASPTYSIRAVVPGTSTTVPGTLNVQITGFLLSPPSTLAPLFLLF